MLPNQSGGSLEAAVADMRAQLRSGVAAAERALAAAGPGGGGAPREPLITISTGDMQTTDPCCQVRSLQPAALPVWAASPLCIRSIDGPGLEHNVVYLGQSLKFSGMITKMRNGMCGLLLRLIVAPPRRTWLIG